MRKETEEQKKRIHNNIIATLVIIVVIGSAIFFATYVYKDDAIKKLECEEISKSDFNFTNPSCNPYSKGLSSSYCHCVECEENHCPIEDWIEFKIREKKEV
ncbi:MAG TPA: hypothetical protein VMZ91_06615 [Candidatus Paceibacterota bacterium]|nr:hypothetical protein [Candidatus Paceibacterota bacterium]